MLVTLFGRDDRRANLEEWRQARRLLQHSSKLQKESQEVRQLFL